ncbi:MAG: Npt1/Npt2 family nucleotide transporter [Bacteroidota bacterium]|nr:Npt1/Npt2 family nucleotide transporter [Bacteroidota bacterium]
MDIKANIQQLLNVKKGESKIIALPMAYSFFAGSAFAFFVTGATSLLLNNKDFSRELIPLSFIVAGILVIFAGKLFARIQNKFSFTATLKSALAFLSVSVPILLVLYYLKPNSLILVFIIYAWIRIFAYVHAVTFWGMLGRIFSIQQGKRLFALISGGEVIAAIISFFSVPFLINHIQTEGILILSGLSLSLAFVLMVTILKKFELMKTSSVKTRKQKERPEKKKSSSKFLKHKYYRLFFLIALVPIFAQMFADFIFQTQTKTEFPEPNNLTAFVGVFFGISAIIEFILKTFISGKLITKYGIKLGLLAFPVVLAISFFFASLFGLFYGTATLFFSFVAMGRLFSRAVRTSFNDPATQILYQPLPKEERIRFQNIIESGPKAYGGIIAGIVILGFALFQGVSLVIFSLFLFLITLVWIKIASATHKEYKIELQDILSERETSKEPSKYKIILNILVERLKSATGSVSQKTEHILHTLYPYHNTEIADKTEYSFNKLVNFSKSENVEKRKLAAKYLYKYKIYKIEKILHRLMRDSDNHVSYHAIIAAGKTKHEIFYRSLLNMLSDIDRKDAAYSAIFHVGEKIIPQLSVYFRKYEGNIKLQTDIIKIFESIESSHSKQFLLAYFNHPVAEVNNRIIKALSHTNTELPEKLNSVANQILNSTIADYTYACACLNDLTSLSKREKIHGELQQCKIQKKIYIYDILSILYDKQSINKIRKYTEAQEDDARSFALEIADLVFNDTHKEILLPILNNFSNRETIKALRLFAPQENMKPAPRLIDIAFAGIPSISIYAKTLAIELLQNYNHQKTIETLKVNLLNPFRIIKEVSALSLKAIAPEALDSEIDRFNIRYPELVEIYNKITYNGDKGELLDFELIRLIMEFPIFANITFSDLIHFTKNSKRLLLTAGKEFIPKLETNFYTIITGEIYSADKKMTFEYGKLITAFNSEENKIYTTPTAAILLETNRIFLNDFFREYPNFVKQFEIR